MDTPRILHRDEYTHGETSDFQHDIKAHSSTYLLGEVAKSFTLGTVNVQMFSSIEKGQNGGVAIRITIDDKGSSSLPVSKNIDGGIEFHVSGDIEASAVMAALKEALEKL
ncbi:hypothetical protein UNDYM_2288 [Undibacterium sp. YM2]|uniref:hypothetical protein n=1 Tax=Undibacterium sp. YM2 TaxID=2058625 RepID=UPI001331EF52|nr:hypothetical protein [Undibacterium sp. YM2]BBB66541.1 hypothetical protein UNDYM_2288 [Undibacterium sp. YM2]